MFYGFSLMLKDKNRKHSQEFEAHTIVENSAGNKMGALKTAIREQQELGYEVFDIRPDGVAKTVEELLHY